VTNPSPKPLPYERWTLVGGFADVSTISATDASVRLQVRAPEPVTLVINSPFFPGWRVSLDDQPISPTIRPESGYMEVAVPAGPHRVDAVFGRSAVRAGAEILTLISLMVWILLLSWDVIRRRRHLPREVVSNALAMRHESGTRPSRQTAQDP
jgi:hypothetical protein